MVRLLESVGYVDRLTGKKASNESKKRYEALRGDPISSIVYTVHKRITKIMNTVHINT
jgi:hypothetical protein